MLRRLSAAATSLATGASDRISVQLLRYAVVGGVAAAVDFGVLVALTSGLGVNYLISNVCGFVAGLVVNYLLSVKWVFSSRSVSSPAREFAIFAAVGVAGLGISEACMFVGVGLLGVHYTLSKVASLAATLLWNFLVRRLLLFRPRAASKEAGR